MRLGNRDKLCSVLVLFFSILLISHDSFSYPIAGKEAANGKCRIVRLDECGRVRLNSSHPVWVHLPRAYAAMREVTMAFCLAYEATTQPPLKGLAVLKFQAEQIEDNFTACEGSVGPFPLQLQHGSSNEGKLYVLLEWVNYLNLLSSFRQQPEVLTVKLSCQTAPSVCLKLSLDGHTTDGHLAPPGYKAALARRDARETTDVLTQSFKWSGYNSGLLVLLTVVGFLAFMISAAVCAKGEHGKERAPPSSTGKKESSSRVNQQEMLVLSNGVSSEAVAGALPPSPIENGLRSNTLCKGVDSEEVRISMGFPDSPLSIEETTEHDKKRVSHGSTCSPPVSEEARSRKSQEPLPQPPILIAAEVAPPIQQAASNKHGEDEQDDEEEDDPPYDYARVQGQEGDEGSSASDQENRDNNDDDGRKVPGKYGKVTRHSGVALPPQETSYAEVRDVVERRNRSATEPIDPSSLRDPMPLPRTFTDSASHLPLPAIPSFQPGIRQSVAEEDEDEDDMYDSVKDDVKQAAISAAGSKKKHDLYETMDEMEQDDSVMYESVPEDVKEGVQQLQPLVVQPPPPKSTRMIVYPSNSPSPTKRLGSDSTGPPDSPGVVKVSSKKLTKDASKKEKRKSKSEDEEDSSSSKAKKQVKEPGKKEKRKSKLDDEEDSSKSKNFSLFSRRKARSVSAGMGKGRKDLKMAESPQPTSPLTPEHHPPSIPPPAVPLPDPDAQLDDDEDDDGMYDSVTVPRSLSSDWSPSRQRSVNTAKAKSSSLPSNARSAGLSFNARVNDPLPEVPEDSGSASRGAALVIKHNRQFEPSDPRYDIIGTMAQGVPLVGATTQGVLVPKFVPGKVEDAEADPEYDTVHIPQHEEPSEKSDKEEEGRIQHPTKTPVAKSSSISHDDLGYAMVDPSIIIRKRSASLHDSHSVSKVVKDPRYNTIQQLSAEPSVPSSLPPPSSDKVPVVILNSGDPGYDSVKNLSAELNGLPGPGPDKAPVLILVNEHCGTPAEAGAASGIATARLAPVQEDPGYESVTKLVDDDIPDPGYTKVLLDAQPSLEVTNNVYSQVDLIKKHEDRQRKLESLETGSLDVTGSSERLRTPSPAPPVPPAGDLGDLSEFEPPPIPKQNLDASPVKVLDYPYSKVIKTGNSAAVVVDDVGDGDEIPGYTAVDIIATPGEKSGEPVGSPDDLISGYAAVDDVIPPEKRQEISQAMSFEPQSHLSQSHSQTVVGAGPHTATSLQPLSTQHQSLVCNSFVKLQTPASVGNSDRIGEHVYEELDRDIGKR